ncbi:GspE/PulE/PilB domain-containing protein [Glaciimonas immobilis]|uniref:Type II secretion system protein GspE N-terminal domain-containing protein n=1 Tax=Glaciimonas immobilis TaxID=728004 RepID=A0A840RSE5_9BURK|nr:hypothetical protein [Glaciimonas immobilis]KAF3997042.1 hypothetical protein HAV38_15320 [Glaciimonas immobilis]MBB5199886.1 hypothetical protein [Glaciimonas immobilis]
MPSIAPKHATTKLQVELALQRQKTLPLLRLGEALMQESLIAADQLELALQRQNEDKGSRLGEILCDMGFVDQEIMKRILVSKLGIPFIALTGFQFDPVVIEMVPEIFARKFTVIPLYLVMSRMVVAMKDPLSLEALEILAFYTQHRIDPVMASAAELEAVITKCYGAGESKLSTIV